jgi:hypothetical protein
VGKKSVNVTIPLVDREPVNVNGPKLGPLTDPVIVSVLVSVIVTVKGKVVEVSVWGQPDPEFIKKVLEEKSLKV